MSRERYRTPDEDVAMEFGRVVRHHQEARAKFPDNGLFALLVNAASAKGLKWTEALEHVAKQQSSLLHED